MAKYITMTLEEYEELNRRYDNIIRDYQRGQFWRIDNKGYLIIYNGPMGETWKVGPWEHFKCKMMIKE